MSGLNRGENFNSNKLLNLVGGTVKYSLLHWSVIAHVLTERCNKKFQEKEHVLTLFGQSCMFFLSWISDKSSNSNGENIFKITHVHVCISILTSQTGTLLNLSEQQLIDCSWGFGNRGCKGGYPHRAMQWVIKHGGLATEESYGKYLAQVKTRNFRNSFKCIMISHPHC